jgi:hypothetical protein
MDRIQSGIPAEQSPIKRSHELSGGTGVHAPAAGYDARYSSPQKSANQAVRTSDTPGRAVLRIASREYGELHFCEYPRFQRRGGQQSIEEPTSAGAGWRPVSGPLTSNGFIQAIAVAPSSPKTLYVATSDGMIYLNTDVEAQNASLKWSAIKRSNLPQNRPYAAIAIDPKNAKVAYLAVQGFGVGHVFRTDSGGKSWHDVTPSLVVDGRPTQIDTPVNSVLVDPLFPSNVYVATDIGVFVSSDRGTTWQPHGAALPRTAVLELKISIDRKIIAATHGRGAWAIEPLSH